MGKAIEVTRRDHTPSELRRLAAKAADGGKVRRLLGVALVLEGRRVARQQRRAALTVRACATGCIATTQPESPAGRPACAQGVHPP